MTTENQVVNAPELEGQQSQSKQATTVEVEVDGKKFQVPQEVAASIKAVREAEIAAKTNAEQAAAREAELRRQLDAKPKPAATPGDQPKDEIETLLFTDPKAAVNKIKEDAKAEMRAELSATNAQQAFWNSFYEKNDDLKDADIVVRGVFAREFEAMKPMTLEKARDHLAEQSKKELLRLGATPKAKKQPLPSEDGTRRTAPGLNKDSDVSTHSPATGGLSAVIAERRAARRAGGKQASG